MKNVIKIALLGLSTFMVVSCNNTLTSEEQQQQLKLLKERKISYEKLANMLKSDSTDYENCTTCNYGCYPDITYNQLTQWRDNYTNDVLPLISTGLPNGNTKSVYLNLQQLENYICTIKRLNNTVDGELGINLYFIKYNKSDDSTCNPASGTTVEQRNAPQLFPCRLSIAMLPTIATYDASHNLHLTDLTQEQLEHANIPIQTGGNCPISNTPTQIMNHNYICPPFCTAY